MGMRGLAALFALAGCSSAGLSPPGACRYSFSAPESSGGASQRCELRRAGDTALSFEDRLTIAVADGATQGSARLEAADSHRAELGLAGERYGLVAVDYAGHECAQWAGHVFWNVTADAWHVETVGTSGCDGFTFAASFDSP